jgi:hypothetical protein
MVQFNGNHPTTQGGAFESRRREVRDYLTKVPVSWRYHPRDHWRDAWLHDISTSGLALRVAQGPPRVGDEIELVRRDIGWRALGQVVRAQLCAGNKVTVACRLPPPDTCQAWLLPSPHPREACRRLAESDVLSEALEVNPGEPGRMIATANLPCEN